MLRGAQQRSAQANAPGYQGNFVSEWFGHRVYPRVASTDASLADQQASRCPFLTHATGEEKLCVKPASSLGVCTINSGSNRVRQDWLACPYRALDQPLLEDVVRRLFRVAPERGVTVIPAPTLARKEFRDALASAVADGQAGVVYLQDKLGGEISISPTPRSPELSFDVTLVEVIRSGTGFGLGKYGIFEVQTMDFHGTYRYVVKNLTDALRLHAGGFHSSLQANQRWLADHIEGPNIANVFKRTFYQMMLKFQIGGDESCAGCALAIPVSVWDSWQRHLGKPDVQELPDGVFELSYRPPDRDELGTRAPAWIYVFDINVSDESSPNQLVIQRVIATDAESVAHYALEVAPRAAVEGIGATDRVLASIRSRLVQWWPEIGRGPVVV